MTVRVGHIEFLNCYPLYYGLQQRGVLAGDKPVKRPGWPEMEFQPGVPTQLNRWLAEGDIDFGPVSSIAYARNHRCLLLSRHVSISSLGAVESIQLVARKPLKQIRTVALTGQSATAVALLKILFRSRLEQQVDYKDLVGPVDDALATSDAVLLIGDQGLNALHSPWPGTECHDLGQLWQEWTGLPMVYAVWAAREDFAHTHGAELRVVEQELVECMDYGRDHLSEVVDSAAEGYPFDRESLARYFAILRYEFTREYQEGLRRFYELAHEAGELHEVPDFRFIDEFTGPEVPAVLDDAVPGDAAPMDGGTDGPAPGLRPSARLKGKS